jgi:hypothetical protein
VNCALRGPVEESPSNFLRAHLINSVGTGSNFRGGLSFFGKEHSKPTDLNYGAVGLLRGFLGQLLQRFPGLDCSYLTRQFGKKRVGIVVLCGAIEGLLTQLPPEVVLFMSLRA